ncbi:efflux RND transporter permease subunit [Bartonella krasnovii]|uniref:efflux RND transporter permease subunit n=1 Tax=Bartonella krasnovii TaxID=2267275 RepID=UPI001F4CB5AE|nr:efflux RND transporter permease subunit [Bartonella krasnovii]UNF38901.1 efflux RND transporter permease subunit [Bartonella krasnovii]UNF48772.1 efflux RND transporter permease subunit [Bartonella krasnovii]UNF50439.1 efflux RND transporter permease subunit [Bartonella krasnovii]
MSQELSTKQPMSQAEQGGLIALFIRRPVFTFVLNAMIIIAGFAAWLNVDVRELPDVDTPVTTVVTVFSGASAETIDREVTKVIEDAVSRVSGVKTISSTSSFGRSLVQINFNVGVDLNVAASDIRDALSRITYSLPKNADVPLIIKADSNAAAMMYLVVTSPTMSIDDLTTVVDDQIVDAISAVDGVGDVQVASARTKIFQIDIDQAKLASYGLTVADISRVLANMTTDVPVGSLRNSKQALVVRATARLTTPESFEQVVLKPHVHLGDVAHVTLSPDIENVILRINGKTGIGLGIVRKAQSNTLNISAGVRAVVDNLKSVVPSSVHIDVISDDAIFIKSALHEVEVALIIAILSVVLVIFLFLRDIRVTLIPALSLPVALIGTIAAIYLVGFSLNILTFLGLVLATGLVVDDAIVVLENIVRWRNMGIGSRAAAVLGTREVFFAVIATTLTLVAVFVPISFLPGQVGGLFREFGFVLAISILLSSIVALTLCPMLASRFLKEHIEEKEEKVQHHFTFLYKWGSLFHKAYTYSLHKCLEKPWAVVFASLVFATLCVGGYTKLQQELTPAEDRALIFLVINGPQGISTQYLNEQVEQIEESLQPLRDSGEIANNYSIAGIGGSPNTAFLVLLLSPWDKRLRSQQEIVKDVNAKVRQFPAVSVFAAQGNSLGVRGTGQGLQFAILGNDYATLQPIADQLVRALQTDRRFIRPRLTVDATQPQFFIEINRKKASDLGIDITNLGDTLQAMLDGKKIGSINVDDHSYDVKLISRKNPMKSPSNLENIFLKTKDNRYVPLSVIARLHEKAIAPQLKREKRMSAVILSANLAPGITLGEAYQTVQKIASPLLSKGTYVVPLGEAETLNETSSNFMIVFGIAFLIILLVLAAQFESFISGFIIMATVPLGIGCAVIAMLLSGVSLNIYSQIGLILLIGVMAKNGILIVEFADQLRDQGRNVREAVEEAANIRLRPVCMTMICAILGGIPLVLAKGAGAEARIALGWVIVGGLGLATIFTLYVTPVVYLFLGRFIRSKAEEDLRLTKELNQVK